MYVYITYSISSWNTPLRHPSPASYIIIYIYIYIYICIYIYNNDNNSNNNNTRRALFFTPNMKFSGLMSR